MQRSTISYWLQDCPHCGYVAPELSEKLFGIDSIIRSEEWRDLAAPDRRRGLANRFRRRALIEKGLGDVAAAAQTSLHAAWALDDEADASGAKAMRSEAAELLKRSLAADGLDPERAESSRLQLLDVLRRAEQWSEAATVCDAVDQQAPHPTVMAIVRFQRELIEARDNAEYTVGDALEGKG